MDHNCWRQEKGIMIRVANSAYAMADFAKYQADWKREPHSLCAAARFVDQRHLNFHLMPGSPCIDGGCNEGVVRDFDGTPVPRGKAPDIGAYEAPAE